MNKRNNALVVGAGLAGQLAAVALARSGCQVTLIAPERPQVQPGDPYGTARTTALLSGSVAFLEQLGLWEAIREHAAPLKTMQLIDPEGRGQVAFQGSEAADAIDGAFGLNVPNRVLSNALASAIEAQPAISFRSGQVAAVDRAEDRVAVRLTDGAVLVGHLLVAADGARSSVRARCRIPVRHHDYRQFALTFVVAHGPEHHGVSTEFHTATGPMTLVPLPGRRSSIVYVCEAQEGREKARWSSDRLTAELAAKAQGHLGSAEALTILAGPGGFPIHGVHADRLTDHRVALIGEAAHAMPPIGAQGLNSTLMDIAWLSHFTAHARDIGGRAVLRSYAAQRKPDVALRWTAVDGLNRIVLSSNERVSALRGAVTALVGETKLMQQALMGVGMAGPRLFPQP